MHAPSPAALADRTILSSRVFAAPRERVYAAFADPRQLALWWGPKGFTNTIREFDPRPGGWWRFTMHGPDGADYPNESRFVAVEPPERVVFVHEGTVHRFEMTLTWTERGAGTELSWRMVFDSAEEVARLREFIVAANEQNFDRLASVLAAA